MSEKQETAVTEVGSPPAAPRGVEGVEADPRAELLRLAEVLRRTQDERRMIEYLRRRRALR